jgi:hypothetical protein
MARGDLAEKRSASGDAQTISKITRRPIRRFVEEEEWEIKSTRRRASLIVPLVRLMGVEVL